MTIANREPAMCERETELIAALGALAPLDEDLTRHAGVCAACGQVRAVWEAMRGIAGADAGVEHAVLSAPGLIWWRAQLAARRKAVAKAERPVRVMQWAFAAASVIALPVCAAWLAGSQAGGLTALAVLAFLAAPAGGLLYYWKRG